MKFLHMDIKILLIIYAVFFGAAFVKGVTGLGFAILSLPVITNFIDLKTAIPLIIIPSLLGNIIIIVQSGAFRYCVRRFRLLYLSALPGLYGGVLVLTASEQFIGRLALGVASIAYAALGLLKVNILIGRRTESYATVPVGLANGFLNGLTGTQVMPMLPYLFTLGLSKEVFVGAINLGFTVSGVALVIMLHEMTRIGNGIFLYSAVGIVPVTAGVYLGGRLRHRISEEKFKTAVLILLILIGINLILTHGRELPV